MDATNQVINLLDDVLGLRRRGAELTANSQLLGSIPELDSMAVLSVLTSIEEKFGIAIADDEVDGQTFATVATLSAFVNSKLQG
jgi:acyl carrier protein